MQTFNWSQFFLEFLQQKEIWTGPTLVKVNNNNNNDNNYEAVKDNSLESMEQSGHLVYTDEPGEGWGQGQDVNRFFGFSKHLDLILKAFWRLERSKAASWTTDVGFVIPVSVAPGWETCTQFMFNKYLL